MSNNKQAQLLDGYWVIETNKWDANIYTKEQAEKYADTLINSTNCINCSYCSYCSSCRDCSSCSSCSSCRNCSYCSYCSYCRGCRDCSYCSYCRDCSSCSSCSSCSYCSDCSSCSDCSYCRGCRDCSYCSDFKTNPERITSPQIGSRNSHSTYYCTIEHEQVVCGCFKGTLEEFEKAVEKTHGTNQHAQDYFKWIERIKIYLQGGNNEQQ